MIWVGGISLVQKVSESDRGASNAIMMTALGGGSIGGPLVGRLLVGWRSSSTASTTSDFTFALAAFAFLALLGSLLMWGFGEYRYRHTRPVSKPRSSGALRQSLALFRYPNYFCSLYRSVCSVDR